MTKPIRVFYSELSGKFYASSNYKEIGNGVVTITGKKYDVTQDIAHAIVKHEVEFTEIAKDNSIKLVDK